MNNMFNPFFNQDDDMPIEEVIRQYIEREGLSVGKTEEEVDELVQAVIDPSISMNKMANLLGIDMDFNFDELDGMPSPEDILMNLIDDLDIDAEEVDIDGILGNFIEDPSGQMPLSLIHDDFIEKFSFTENPDMLTMINEMEQFITHYSEEWLNNQESPWLKYNMQTFLESKYELAQIYFENGLYSKALQHFKELQERVPEFRKHTRHYIMAIYTKFNDIENASKLFSSNNEHANDDMLLLMYLVLAIISRQDKLSEMLFERLSDANKSLPKLYTDPFSMNLGNILSDYVDDDFEENLDDKREIDFLYKALSYLTPYIFQVEGYIHEYLRHLAHLSTPTHQIGSLHEVSPAAIKALNNVGIFFYEDLENYTEQEIRNIRGIGEVAMRDLKNAGAKFKS